MDNNNIQQQFDDLQCMRCFEVENYADNEMSIYYFEYNADTNQIDIGGACNSGLMTRLSVDYDIDFSIDENLQNMVEATQDFENNN